LFSQTIDDRHNLPPVLVLFGFLSSLFNLK
jgi:hypothetical protein